MAVARLPWLWNLDRIEEVAKEIDRISTRTGKVNEQPVREWTKIQEMWDHMLAEGLALGRFEACLMKRTPTEWRQIADRDRVRPGTLIWQGKLGFGVTMHEVDCCSEDAPAEPVLFLKAEKRKANIQPYLMLPVHQLIRAINSEKDGFGDEDAEALSLFIDQVELLLSTASSL